ncbi:protein phosphatase 1 regulatory subunit 7-like [Amblyraja radiata]|uniref:protein phosphatase 1 regulatory subunit 7-like n=1 Tax=Amblyraja radiata TaxID=386614 RepID=UPI001402A651|nr:protein phosphatase 1 regulatory subunit 7-like [Amblyraja radiata]
MLGGSCGRRASVPRQRRQGPEPTRSPPPPPPPPPPDPGTTNDTGARSMIFGHNAPSRAAMAKSQVGAASSVDQTNVKRKYSTHVTRSTNSGRKSSASVKGVMATNKDNSKCQQLGGCESTNILDLHGKGIKKIQKFDILKGIKILDLSCNFIEEIENLENPCEVTELKLYGNYIRHIKNLDSLQELRVLQLQYNHITSIRKGLLKLRKLQRLRLDSNQLICVESREFSGLSQLTSLDISHNQLTDITAVNGLPCLEELFASHNKLYGVVDLSRCNKLQELDLSNNKISEVHGLSLLETLTSVDLSSNVMCSTERLGILSSLQELNLANNQLKSVCSFSKQFPNLEVLNIANNCIDLKGELRSLAQCCHLQDLHLTGNTGTSEEEQNEHLMQISLLMPQLNSLDEVILNYSNKEQNAPVPKTALANVSLESVQKITSCLMDFESEMEDLQQSIVGRFSEVKNLLETLPKQLPWSSYTTAPARLTSVENYGPRPQTRCSSRSRIEDARSYAAQHFGKK